MVVQLNITLEKALELKELLNEMFLSYITDDDFKALPRDEQATNKANYFALVYVVDEMIAEGKGRKPPHRAN